jgi:hypothetical protein
MKVPSGNLASMSKKVVLAIGRNPPIVALITTPLRVIGKLASGTTAPLILTSDK